MQRKSLENLAIILSALILITLLLTYFTVASPLATRSEVKQEQVLDITDAKANLVELIIEVEHKLNGLSKPVDKILVKIGERTTLTNKEGIARFLVTPMVYTIIVSSPENKLPTWSGEIPVSASGTMLKLIYTELRTNITQIGSTIDYKNRTTIITITSLLPVYEVQENYRTYAGSPLLYYIGSDFKPKVALHNSIYTAEEYTGIYKGVFKSIVLQSISTNYTTTQRVNDIVRLVIADRSYLPIFLVESTIVELSAGE